MDEFLARIFLFTFVPLLFGAGIVLFDRTAFGSLRRTEAMLIPLFALGVAGSGIGSFIAHLFFSDTVAASIGWATGSPFQHEIAFANLAIGLLGVVAAGRRDGFREATVIAVTVFGVGASIVHFVDIAQTGNLAPGNSVQNVANLVKPAALILLLVASRRTERQPGSEALTHTFAVWRSPILQASTISVILISTAFAVGFGVEQVVPVSLLGVAIAAVIFSVMIARSPSHKRGSNEEV